MLAVAAAAEGGLLDDLLDVLAVDSGRLAAFLSDLLGVLGVKFHAFIPIFLKQLKIFGRLFSFRVRSSMLPEGPRGSNPPNVLYDMKRGEKFSILYCLVLPQEATLAQCEHPVEKITVPTLFYVL